MIQRALVPHLIKAAGEFPAVLLTGPRQSGKTTLLKELFGKSHAYVSVEPPDLRAAAEQDPRGFLKQFGPPVILDEIQYVPTLLPYIKEMIDADRSLKGRFLLTGSQNLLLMQQVTESLAGRVAMLRLLPLSWREAQGRAFAPLPWERGAGGLAAGPLDWKAVIRGGYPELTAEPERDPGLWHSSYMQTYMERDVRLLRQVGDLTTFQNFLRLLAQRNAQLLNMAAISRDLGVSLNTAKAWLAVLEATFQVLVLRPYFNNAGTRLVKTPKVYFTDTGTLCHLTGLTDPSHASKGPMAGGLFETVVVMEVFKTLWHRGIEPKMWFWRTSNGVEVDLVVECAGVLQPLEVKLSSTPVAAMASPLRSFSRAFKGLPHPGIVVHPGDVELPLGEGARAWPFLKF